MDKENKWILYQGGTVLRSASSESENRHQIHASFAALLLGYGKKSRKMLGRIREKRYICSISHDTPTIKAK